MSSHWVPCSVFVVFACLVAIGCSSDDNAKGRVPSKPPVVLEGSLKWQVTGSHRWEKSDSSLQTGIEYTFSATIVPDMGRTIEKIEWRFGDSGPTSEAKHTFQISSGEKATVNIKVTDDKGASGERDFLVPLTQDAMPLNLSVVEPSEPLEINVDLGEYRDIPFGFAVSHRELGIAGQVNINVDDDSAIDFVVYDDHRMVPSEILEIPGSPQSFYYFTLTCHAATAFEEHLIIDTPSLKIRDTEGRQSNKVFFPRIIIRTVDTINNPPEIDAVVAPSQGEGVGPRHARLSITIKDDNNDYVDWIVNWGDGREDKGAVSGTEAGKNFVLTHEYSSNVSVGDEMIITVTANDGRKENSEAVPKIIIFEIGS